MDSEKGTSTPCSSTRKPSAWTNIIWGWPRTIDTRFISKMRVQYIGNNSKFLRPITNL
jgi:hypothetical protein